MSSLLPSVTDGTAAPLLAARRRQLPSAYVLLGLKSQMLLKGVMAEDALSPEEIKLPLPECTDPLRPLCPCHRGLPGPLGLAVPPSHPVVLMGLLDSSGMATITLVPSARCLNRVFSSGQPNSSSTICHPHLIGKGTRGFCSPAEIGNFWARASVQHCIGTLLLLCSSQPC